VILGVLPPGPLNAITDVEGVRVGHCTISEGPARAGVTAILPPPDDLFHHKVPAAGSVFNGCGEMTGLWWVNESGFLEVPILMTDTLSVGRVLDGAVDWYLRRYAHLDDVFTPVVGECDNSWLSDVRGRHVRPEHAVAALDAARGGPVEEGGVGAGTGMTCYDYKGGIGTSSRVCEIGEARWTVGVLINDNHGRRRDLVVAGRPLGRDLGEGPRTPDGSYICVVATDAPLDARALARLAARTPLGIARTGGKGNRGSGDFCLAFSTRNSLSAPPPQAPRLLEVIDERHLDPLFDAVIEATEEAVVNALFAGQTTVGHDGHVAEAFPIEALGL
jgi:D-aminopeptidase